MPEGKERFLHPDHCTRIHTTRICVNGVRVFSSDGALAFILQEQTCLSVHKQTKTKKCVPPVNELFLFSSSIYLPKGHVAKSERCLAPRHGGKPRAVCIIMLL